MAAARIREAERDATTGGPEEAGRLFVERSRADRSSFPDLEGPMGDDLPVDENFRLAAYCGSAAAVSVVGDQLCRHDGGCAHGEEDGTCSRSVPGWISGLWRWGSASCIRASVAAARSAYPWWERANKRCSTCGALGGGCRCFAHGSFPPRTRDEVLGAIIAVENWILCPCDAHAAACAKLVHLVPVGARTTEWWALPAWCVADGLFLRPLSRCWIWAIEGSSGVIETRARSLPRCTVVGDDHVLGAVRAELASWALGEIDPVRARSEGSLDARAWRGLDGPWGISGS